MKIIILGAGQVGYSVAKSLAGEANDIVIVDPNEKLLQNLQNHLDVQVLKGHGAHPDILRQAGAEDADMLLAVTNSDETNIVACQVAYTLFRIPSKIARVREPNYLQHPQLFSQESFAVDQRISPEELVTHAIRRLIDYPDALQVLDFADGRVQLVAVKAYYGGPLVGHELRTLHQHIPSVDTRVAVIYRQGEAIIPEGWDIIQADDEVFFIAAAEHVRTVMSELRQLEKPARRIIIGGGGNIGTRLAKALERDHHVKLIECNSKRTEQISVELEHTIVLDGDIVDAELLQEEHVAECDMFCALTDDEQVNMLSGMLAKRMGARQVLSLINRVSYIDLVENSNIDIVISPPQVTIGALLSYVRRGDIMAVHSLRRGAAEAIEIGVHGKRSNSKVVGRRIDEIKMPPGTTICAVVRGEQVLMAHHDTTLEDDDRVILFLVDKTKINAVERLFQAGVLFL